MSISNCFIQMNRFDLTKTQCEFTMLPIDGIIECGLDATFTIRVSTLTDDDVLGGTVSIIDYDTHEVLAEAENTTGVTEIIMEYPGNGLDGYRRLYAHFSGVIDQFEISSSANRVTYIIKSISEIIISGFSSHSIVAASPGLVYYDVSEYGTFQYPSYPPGTVSFILYRDNNTTVGTIADQVLTTSLVIATIPANTMIAGNRYYMSAFYSGCKCVEPSCTGIGTSGYYIDAI